MRRGDSKERLDPKFILHGGHQVLKDRNVATLGSLVTVEPDYGSGFRAIPITTPDSIKYIRITDFDDDGIPPNHEFVTAETIEQKYMLKEGDLLFARSGATAGKTFLYAKEVGPAIFAGYCIRFQFNRKKVLPMFIYYCTKTSRYAAWVRSIQRPSGQPNINKEEFKSFTIPLLSLNNQQNIVSDLEAAREARKRKLAEADALLAGIDGYLMEKLGLKLPGEEKKQVFAVRLKDISKARVDSHFHTPFFRKTEETIRSLTFKLAELSTLLQTPPLNGVDARDYLDAGQRYLRVQNVRPYELLMDDIKYVSSDSKKDVALKSGDVLLTRKGTYGVAASVPKEAEDCLISSEIMLLRLSPDAACLSEYLVAYLNSSAAKILLNRHKTGGIMGHITQEVVSAFPVPVPPMEIQQSIAAEITRRRDEVRRLRAEAANEWKEAKGRFERQLLG